MSLLHVSHLDIARFAENRVNLRREDAKDFRDQARRLRERLEQYIKEHPTFELRRMQLSGSLSKGTALKSLDDIDVAVYISMGEAPLSTENLIPWLAEKLRKAFPNIKPEQVIENPFTVTFLFSGSGLKVDIVPVMYEGDPDWKGYLVSKTNGERILTSIPQHIDFIRRRKKSYDLHYAQVIRLLKFWVRQRRAENPNFRFKSFMVELFVAHLADGGLDLSDYPEALAEIFARIATDAFQTTVAFDDYYDSSSSCSDCSDPIRIWDPVNCENNTARRYDEARREAIVEAALEAGDAIDSALRSTTKADTIRHWRRVFGPTFDV